MGLTVGDVKFGINGFGGVKFKLNLSLLIGGEFLLDAFGSISGPLAVAGIFGDCGLFGDFRSLFGDLRSLFGEFCNFRGLKIETELVFIFKSLVVDDELLRDVDSGAFSEIGFRVLGSIFTIECFLISPLDGFSFSGLTWTLYIGFTPEAGLPKREMVVSKG